MAMVDLKQRSFAPLLKKDCLSHIRFYDSRPTYATLLSKGVRIKFVKELLRLSAVVVTLDTYLHTVSGMGDWTAAV